MDERYCWRDEGCHKMVFLCQLYGLVNLHLIFTGGFHLLHILLMHQRRVYNYLLQSSLHLILSLFFRLLPLGVTTEGSAYTLSKYLDLPSLQPPPPHPHWSTLCYFFLAMHLQHLLCLHSPHRDVSHDRIISLLAV